MEYILCCDADCFMGEQWMLSMVRCAVNDQYSLVLGPVCVVADQSFLQQFQLIEASCLQSVTAGSAQMQRAVMANGANLLFRKPDYLSVAGSLTLASFESGDDIAILHVIKKYFGGKAIGYARDPYALVNTLAEDTIRDFFWQHVRWAAKSKGYKDADTIFLAIVTAFENLLILLLAITSFFDVTLAWVFGFTIVVKGLAEFQLVRKAENISEQRVSRIAYIFSTFIYPFFASIVLLASLGKSYQWKGRRVK